MNSILTSYINSRSISTYICASLFLIHFQGFTQIYSWSNYMDSPGHDFGMEINVEYNGAVYTTGRYSQTIDLDPGPGVDNYTSTGLNDVFLQKQDTAGNYLWGISLGGSQNDDCEDIAVDDSGNVYIYFQFEGTVDMDPGSGTVMEPAASGFKNAALIKLDANGNYVWHREIIGSGHVGVRSLERDENGDFYMVGGFTGTVDFAPGALMGPMTASSPYAVYILKLNSQGSLVRAQQIFSPTHINQIGLDVHGDKLAIGGKFTGTVDFDPTLGTNNITNTSGTIDGFIVVMDTAGNFDWAGHIDGSGYSTVWGIGLTNNEDVIVTGNFLDQSDFDLGAGTNSLTSVGASDVFVAKYQSGGILDWVHQFGEVVPISDNAGYDLDLDAAENIYVGGYFNSPIDFDPGPGVAADTSSGAIINMFLLSLTQVGEYRWHSAFHGNGDSYIRDVSVDQIGNLYATGTFTLTRDFDPGPGVVNYTASGFQNDVFALKIKSICEQSPASVTTNITSNYNGHHVSCFGSLDGSVEALTGGSGSSYSWNTGDTTSAISGLGAGTYAVTVIDANGCSAMDTVVLGEPAQMNVSASVTSNFSSYNVSCSGGSDGEATATASGGVSPYNYNWSSGGTGSTETGLSAGTYTVHFTDLNGCQDSAAVILTEPSSIVVTLTSTPQTDTCDGSASVVVAGGVPGYTYLWDTSPTNQTTSTAIALCEGTYCVTVTDTNACTLDTCLAVGSVSGIPSSWGNDHVQLWPNPAHQTIHIQLDPDILTEPVSLQILAMDGRLVHQEYLSNPTQLINFNLAPGVYAIRISIPKQGAIEKKLMIR